MQTPVSQNERAAQRSMLSTMQWHVWFLGYGLGGCAGIAMIAGIWSLVVDSTWIPGSLAIAISATHAACMFFFWLKRSSMLAKPAILICFSLSAIGLAAVAFLLTAYRSHVPSLHALYSLAAMTFIMGLVISLTPKTKTTDPEKVPAS